MLRFIPSHRPLCKLPQHIWKAFLLLILVAMGLPPVLSIGADDAKPKPMPEWRSLFDGKSLKNWVSSEFGGEGEVAVKEGIIVMQQGSEMTGITWMGGELPKMDYEVLVEAKRIDGSDFFCGMTFQVGEFPCSFIIGGWGGGVVGISSLDGLDAANNETARYESFESEKWYKIRLRVTKKGLMGWIDDKQVVGVETKGRKISIRHEVELSRPFGISCYSTVSGLKEIKIRKLTPEEAAAPITTPELPKANDLKQ
ncbi:MAG: DUF1080 domain-containing protein [Planctomycetes bacterium]|nr:DUF1080 domain-containing protein [Planctomycetota bacterium]